MRDDGVLLVGAGTLIHNLRLVHFHGKFDAPDEWAVAFERWLAPRLDDGRVDDIVDYRRRAVREPAAPTTNTRSAVLPAGGVRGELPTCHYDAIRYGNGLLRVMTFGGQRVETSSEALCHT